ncbi:MAG TPA: sigma-70 family RNA polymerase sigma factor, partial [Gemmataceae bacterium]|nr:sigma-70 family RNA polymerase sigma factor [Gemmataceae bacterium]
MPTNPLSTVIQHILADVGPDRGAMTDGELLGRYLSSRDDNALAVLVRRHAPMVWGVCCRLLHNHHDAEDAFQATFLVLVRKGKDVPRQAVANWLYGVARQTGVRLRATGALRGRREKQVLNMPEPTRAEVRDADWQSVLDEELGRLPGHYRAVIVLCDLEDMTRKEAARQLAIPEGSVASRLMRARLMLAKRLTRRGVVFSGGSLAAVLSAASASASAPPALVASTIKATSLLGIGKAAAAGVLSAKVAALTEGVVRAMFLAKLKTVTCALALTVLVGLGGVALVPGSGNMPAAGAATAPQDGGDAKPDGEAQKLVRQLGDLSFTKRHAAEKALASMGARAAASVRVGMRDADPEIAKRCTAIWPRLWQTEYARPDADRLAGYAHPLWLRFRKVAGDDASSRKLFTELAADFRRFAKLEAIDADPAKAADAYAAELKVRVEALNQGWREAEAAAGFRTGMIRPRSGYPTQAKFATLLFLGTFPSTAAITFRGTGDRRDSASYRMVFALSEAHSYALRRLFAAWLETRTDQEAIQIGLSQTVRYPISEVLPAARKHGGNAELASGTRALSLLVIGRLGGAEDLPLLKRAFADTRVWYTTKWSSGTGNERAIEVQVADTAIGCALWIYGQRAADFDFPIAEMLRNHPDTLAQHGMLGFFDNDTRRAAHKKAAEWLEQHKNDKATRYRVKDWQMVFDGKTTNHWKTEGQVAIEDGLLKI